MIRLLPLLLCLAACGPVRERGDQQPSTPSVEDTYAETAARAAASFIDEHGRIVHRKSDGSPEHLGDSLIWSGVALYALPCAAGDRVEQALVAETQALGGQLQRHPSLPGKVSLDGALGLYFGVADRIQRCPGAAERWRPAIAAHLAFVERSGGRLNLGDEAKLHEQFNFVLHLLAHRLGLRGEPHQDRLRILETQLAGWARAVMVAKAPCFRLNLSWLTLETVEILGGGVSAGGRRAFCDAAASADIPTIDAYCGRPERLAAYLEAFEWDAWDYRHQRCGGWEGPDGRDNASPALDRLVALRQLYAIP